MGKEIQFIKIDNNHNNYIYLWIENDYESHAVYSVLSKKMCDPLLGIGGDGIILLKRLSPKKFQMRIYNKDGSHALMCGNGLKGAALYLQECGYLEDFNGQSGHEDVFYIHTDSGTKKIIRKMNISSSKKMEFLSNIGRPDPYMNICGLRQTLNQYSLVLWAMDIGNKHFIYFIEQDEYQSDKNLMRLFEDFPLRELFERTHENYFFEKWEKGEEVVNVSLCLFHENQFYLRTYERGAGETYACGTASAATSGIIFRFYENISNYYPSFKNVLDQNRNFFNPLSIQHKGGKLFNYYIKDSVFQQGVSFILARGIYYNEE